MMANAFFEGDSVARGEKEEGKGGCRRGHATQWREKEGGKGGGMGSAVRLHSWGGSRRQRALAVAAG
jgi:hypothetical protein